MGILSGGKGGRGLELNI